MDALLSLIIDLFKPIITRIKKIKIDVTVYNFTLLKKDDFTPQEYESNEPGDFDEVIFVNYKLVITTRPIILKTVQLEIKLNDTGDPIVCNRIFKEGVIYKFSGYSKKLTIPLEKSSVNCNYIKPDEVFEFNDTFISKSIEFSNIKCVTFVLFEKKDKKYKYTIDKEAFSNVGSGKLEVFLGSSKFV